MIKTCMYLGLILAASMGASCIQATDTRSVPEGGFYSDFETLDQWQDDTAGSSPRSYHIQDRKLYMSTRADTKDRVKVRTHQRFGPGTYTWRVYAPTLGQGDQFSIGAFLYHNDQREIDFEIGSGTAKVRRELNAKPDDLVCYCTSQGGPFSSTPMLIKREAWYELTIDLSLSEDNHYHITWSINGKVVKTRQTTFGPDIRFTAHCSTENLSFLGDHTPQRDNHALFDFFEFSPAAGYEASGSRREGR